MGMVEQIFKRVTFDDVDKRIHQEIVEAIKQIAQVIDESTPDCAEKMLAFRALHLATMHFGNALSKQNKYDKSVS